MEPYCRFHFEAGSTLNTSSVARLYTKTLTRWGIGAIPYVESFPHEPFAALGSLNPNQWHLLRQGQELRLGQMPMPQRTRGEEWMMKDPFYLKVDPAANVPDLFHDWTEYAPNGLPPGATVSLEIKTGYVYRQLTMIKYPDGSIKEGSLNGERGNSPEEIAKGFAQGGYYKSFDQMIQGMRMSKGQVSQRTDYTFRFRLLPTHMIEETFNGSLTDSKMLPMTSGRRACGKRSKRRSSANSRRRAAASLGTLTLLCRVGKTWQSNRRKRTRLPLAIRSKWSPRIRRRRPTKRPRSRPSRKRERESRRAECRCRPKRDRPATQKSERLNCAHGPILPDSGVAERVHPIHLGS